MHAFARRPWHRAAPHLVALGLAALGMGIFIAINLPLRRSIGPSRESLARSGLVCFREAVRAFEAEYGRPPRSYDDLQNPPRTDIIVCCSAPVDPWGNPWIFETSRRGSLLARSLGADGLPGGTGADADLSSDDF